MFGKQVVDSDALRASRHGVDGRVSFMQRDRVAGIGKNGQHFAEAPYAALVGWMERCLAVAPQGFERGRANGAGFDGVGYFQEIAASDTAEVARRFGEGGVAADASQLGLSQAGFRHWSPELGRGAATPPSQSRLRSSTKVPVGKLHS